MGEMGEMGLMGVIIMKGFQSCFLFFEEAGEPGLVDF
jgi:hypothetical protein